MIQYPGTKLRLFFGVLRNEVGQQVLSDRLQMAAANTFLVYDGDLIYVSILYGFLSLLCADFDKDLGKGGGPF